MMSKGIISKHIILAAVFMTLFLITNRASAQNDVRIINRWYPTHQINIQKDLTVGKVQPNWWSAQWHFEKVKGTDFYRIKCKWKKNGKTHYLHNQSKKLEVGSIQTGWWSAMWTLEKAEGFFRIKNRWTGEYIHNQNRKLELGKIKPNWWSAMWKLKGFNDDSKPSTTDASNATTQNIIKLKNYTTNRYVASTGEPLGDKKSSGGWRGAPEVLGTDANYYNRAEWDLIPVKGKDYFIIRNVKTKSYLMCPNDPIRNTDAQDGGWSKSKAILESDANYYNRAAWKITRVLIEGGKGKEVYFLTNVKTNRLLLSTGDKPTTSEGGWLKSPKIVSADANYYHRAVWYISGDGKKLLTADKVADTRQSNDNLYLTNIDKNSISSKHWYNIKARGMNKVLDISASSTKNGTNVGFYGKHSNQNYKNQHFRFVHKGNGIYEIHTQLKQARLIEDASRKGAKGGNIQLYEAKNTKNQRFRILKDKDGYYYFKSILERDSYLGWKKLANGKRNLEIVKYTGKGSEKSMQFEFLQWRQISTSNIPLHIVSDFTTQAKNGGNVIKYDVKKIAYLPMKTAEGKTMAKIKLNLKPETAFADGFLYGYVKMDGVRIEMSNYIDQNKKKGYYLKDLVVTITSKDKYDLELDNPENLNATGQYTKSESFSIGANASNGGGGGSGSYTWGSSFNRSVKDFNFTNETEGRIAQFHWNLSGSENGPYENYRSLGVKTAGQYGAISDLPAMAKKNFPVDCEVVFRKYLSNLPNKVNININVKATFEKSWLTYTYDNGFEEFFNGFGALVNPKTYDGELAYRFDHDEKTTENNIELELDVSKLK